VEPPEDIPRTTRLLAERWATLFCSIQRRLAFGDALKFVGAFLAAVAWFTFLVLAKGTTDCQASDLVFPIIMTVSAVAIAAFGFRRQHAATRELREATDRLARELDKRPQPQADEELPSVRR